MADIFNSRPGIVAVIPDQNVIPGRIKLADFDPVAALVAAGDFDQETNQQFQTSLDESVYIYVFGDRMGTVTVSGMIFSALCDGNANGLSEIFAFYSTQRASRRADPIQVVFGDEAIVGFLVKLRIRAKALAEDPGGAHQEFFLDIATLPKD